MGVLVAGTAAWTHRPHRAGGTTPSAHASHGPGYAGHWVLASGLADTRGYMAFIDASFGGTDVGIPRPALATFDLDDRAQAIGGAWHAGIDFHRGPTCVDTYTLDATQVSGSLDPTTGQGEIIWTGTRTNNEGQGDQSVCTQRITTNPVVMNVIVQANGNSATGCYPSMVTRLPTSITCLPPAPVPAMTFNRA